MRSLIPWPITARENGCDLLPPWLASITSTVHVPIIAELQMPIPELNLDGKLNLEYDVVLQGNNISYNAYRGENFIDDEYENNNE